MPADEVPSEEYISRRKLLVAGSALGISALAGCSTRATSQTADCSTSVVEHGDGDVLQQASAMRREESVELLISLQQPGDQLSVTRILIRNSDGDLLHEIPTTDAREYRQVLGSLPRHGRLKLLAHNQQQGEIDSLTIDFNCPANH